MFALEMPRQRVCRALDGEKGAIERERCFERVVNGAQPLRHLLRSNSGGWSDAKPEQLPEGLNERQVRSSAAVRIASAKNQLRRRLADTTAQLEQQAALAGA